jgi:hypothetical protein
MPSGHRHSTGNDRLARGCPRLAGDAGHHEA